MTTQQPEALPAIQRFEVVDCIDSKHVPAVIPNSTGPWVRYEDHVAELRRLHAYCQDLESQVILDCMTHVQNPVEIEHVAGDVSKNGAGLNMSTQHARITELEAARFAYASEFAPTSDGDPDVSSIHANIRALKVQLAQRFDAADMATAAAQGFRDGVASLSANAWEPRNAIGRDALIDAIAQGLHGTWHCTRVWEAWHVGTMSQDDFEPVDESETPTEIADAVLALLAATPTAQAEGWISVDERLPGEQGPADGESNE